MWFTIIVIKVLFRMCSFKGYNVISEPRGSVCAQHRYGTYFAAYVNTDVMYFRLRSFYLWPAHNRI